MERFKEQIEQCVLTHLTKKKVWYAEIYIFGTRCIFSLEKLLSNNNEVSYTLKGYFINLYQFDYMGRSYCYQPLPEYCYFVKETQSNLDCILKIYFDYVEKLKTKEGMLECKKEYVERQTAPSVMNILSDCSVCHESIAANFCKECGVPICSFCMYRCENKRTKRFKCVHCRIIYTCYHRYSDIEDESDSDESDF